jgi:glycosyltransferase involved in cell wall biosynthesis
LSDASGGLQICTHEYVRTLRAAGIDLTFSTIAHDRRMATRIRRRLAPAPYPSQWRSSAVSDIVSSARRVDARLVLLNLVNLAPLARALKPRLPAHTRIVLLSHGLESVDFLHTIPFDSHSRRQQSELGKRLLAERRHRLTIDHVFTLTSWEAEIERWLGARNVTALPRTVTKRAPLEWRPDASRLGFVGTLDHVPNRDGLEQFLTALEQFAPARLHVRLVGGPEASGRSLAGRFRSVRYLGPLDDRALESEASTWSAFVHPLFCFARGCSTKLAIALAWRIPVVTTRAGARGYTWREGALPMADSPESLARLACDMTDRSVATRARDEIAAIARSCPTTEEVGRMIEHALLGAGREGGVTA